MPENRIMDLDRHHPATLFDDLAATFKIDRRNVGLDDVSVSRSNVFVSDPLRLHHESVARFADLAFSEHVSLEIDRPRFGNHTVDDLLVFGLVEGHRPGLFNVGLFVLVVLFLDILIFLVLVLGLFEVFVFVLVVFLLDLFVLFVLGLL